MRKVLINPALCLAVAAGAPAAFAQVHDIDMNVPGAAINRGILGTNYTTQRDWAPVADRTFITGVAGGLDAEIFNWETRVGTYDWPTLGVLRNIRDSGSTPMFIVNLRGTGVSDGYSTDVGFHYTDTTLPPLVTLASDWVRYTNFIVPDGPQNASDQAILNKISGSYDKLLLPGEALTPKVKYWEIGNEPEAYIDGIAYGGPFGTRLVQEYVDRYIALSTAMKAVDPTIKVGPAMVAMTSPVGPSNYTPPVAMPLLNSSATVDFWGYHTYDDLDNYYKPNGTPTEIASMEAQLRGVRPYQVNLYNLQRSFFTAAGRNPDNVEFAATEWNPMGTGLNDASAPTMYQALAFAETVFAYADLNLKSANYWGLLAYEPADPKGLYNLWPMVKLWQKMNQKMGDTLVESIIDDAHNLRAYVTRDSLTGKVTVWGLNFSNSNDGSLDLSLLGLNADDNALLSTLNDGSNTTLWTAHEAVWTTQNLTNFDAGSFNLAIPHASIVMLEIQPVPEPGMAVLMGLAGCCLPALRRRGHQR